LLDETDAWPPTSKKHRQILRQQDILIQQNLPPGDLPLAIDLA
jgi:hypothetical protein